MPKVRTPVPNPLRAQILIANQHACCVCGKSGVQIHHINSDPTDNRSANLAVLCLPHHDKATVVTGLSRKLSPSDIRKYKRNWERQCHERVLRAARGRTAFFMVDYKNAERIRQLYDQLSFAEQRQAYDILSKEFQEEEVARKKQHFDISSEPNTRWDEITERLLTWLQSGDSQPEPFLKIKGHAKDPLLPTGAIWIDKEIWLYDIWCQIMVRAIISVRTPYDLDDLLRLQDPRAANIQGSLIAFEGSFKGKVKPPGTWKQSPITHTRLTRSVDSAKWWCDLKIKTHYVYSVTAAESLSDGYENGLLFLRSIKSARRRNGRISVEFDAVPLIIGSGILKL
jgi:hypothetical protein